MDMLTTPPRTIGMDLGDKHSNLYVIEADGDNSEQTRIATTKKAVAKYFSRCPTSRVALEVGAHSRWVSEIVESFGHEVLVANARKLRAIYENDNKSDYTDPQILAEIARVQPSLLSPIKHRGEEAQAALAVLRSRDCAVRVRTKLINHIRGATKATGERIGKSSAESFPEHLAEIPEQRREALQPLVEVIEMMTGVINAYDKTLDELCKAKFPETKILRQIKGVGPVTSLAFITTLEDPHRFRQNRKVASMLGLRPGLDQSGKIDKQKRITKAGDPLLRRLLVTSSQYILGPKGPDTDLKRWGLKLAERGGKNGKKRAVVGVARKLAVLLLKLWKTGESYVPLRQPDEQPSGGTVAAVKLPDLRELLEARKL